MLVCMYGVTPDTCAYTCAYGVQSRSLAYFVHPARYVKPVCTRYCEWPNLWLPTPRVPSMLRCITYFDG